MFCRPWFMNYWAHVISAEDKARLDEVTNLPSMYNGPIDACPTQDGNFVSPIICSGEFHRAERMFNGSFKFWENEHPRLPYQVNSDQILKYYLATSFLDGEMMLRSNVFLHARC